MEEKKFRKVVTPEEESILSYYKDFYGGENKKQTLKDVHLKLLKMDSKYWTKVKVRNALLHRRNAVESLNSDTPDESDENSSKKIKTIRSESTFVYEKHKYHIKRVKGEVKYCYCVPACQNLWLLLSLCCQN